MRKRYAMEWFGKCPFCGKLIPLKKRKDFESFTCEEVEEHMDQEHPKQLRRFHRQNHGFNPYIYQYRGDEVMT